MLNVDLHDVKSAEAHSFMSGGKRSGSVRITAENGDSLKLYTTPAKAKAIADAVNAKEGE